MSRPWGANIAVGDPCPGRHDRSACLVYAMPGVDSAEAARQTMEIDRYPVS